MFTTRDPQLIVDKAIERLGTVRTGGTLYNTTDDTLEGVGYRKKYRTPFGVYKTGKRAYQDSGLDINYRTFLEWCSYPDRMITTTARNKFPEIFEGHLTYKEAGFRRLG